jgi:dTDP-4-dehydrorhamnose 3,5-epimerase
VKFAETELQGVLIIDPDVFGDDRGFFMETYNRRRYAQLPGLDVEFVQDNRSRSRKNVLRGLHFQRRYPQGKLISVSSGHVWDVAVDIDPASPTFRRWVGVDLTEANRRQFYVPPGYAHGFCVVSEQADLVYKCTEFYQPDDEQGVAWNDADLNIRWPIREPILSNRDASNPTLRQYLGR